MRTTSTSLSLAAAATVFLLLLLTTAMEVEAIRLDAESRAAVSQQQQVNVANKPSETLTTEKNAPGGERSSPAGESETKRSVAVAVSVAGQEVVKATAHKLPEFHEDYYGASVHEPRHH
ncbi:uncharacterized protein LOC8155353 isoform X2 [Sorghum bicolor]|uniref:uncharacterized protein LOC8155353 isoform X2 n=1 Tax=Sorghum bicolor TaxID=4558 RepID=UPI000B4259DA|nr:uncharacterized protein LOC8155353 isoform X2 [Sorghum bicolor]|eukprot:XP_021316226.1 uncharacterized protein LOC8155353 isoform X2 [Sorghum bicolor]